MLVVLPRMKAALKSPFRFGFTLIATLGVPVGAQAATRSVQVAASISPGNCFGPEFKLQGLGGFGYFESSTQLLFNVPDESSGDTFCQARIASGSSIVQIYDASAAYGDCLALNGSNANVYLHNASGCNGTSDNYLQWKFVYIDTDSSTGNKQYQLQNQYTGDNGVQCLQWDTSLPPATHQTCKSLSPGVNYWDQAFEVWFIAGT
jgi:hypothetical protein